MTETFGEAPGVLDLSGADTKAFDAIDGGRYDAEIWDAEWQATKPDSQGALGPNVPYVNIQFKITAGDYENRRVFTKYFPVVPEGYDAAKGAKNQGAFVNFLVALGLGTEAEVKSASFKIDFEAMKGKACSIVVSKDAVKGTDPVEWQNNVKGVRPLGDQTSTTSGSSLL